MRNLDSAVLEMLRRDSGISLSADGVFHYRDAPVENTRVQALFHQGLSVREDGEVILSVGKMWAYVQVATVATFVAGLRRDAQGLHLRLRSGRTLLAATPVLASAPDARFYVWPGPGEGVSCFDASAHRALIGLLELREETLGLTVGSKWCPVEEIGEIPHPLSAAPIIAEA